MTKKSKVAVLAAFDALCSVENGAPVKPFPPGTVHKGGKSARCDVCGLSLASGEAHSGRGCPIGDAIAAVMRLVPPFAKRDEWLNDETAPDLAHELERRSQTGEEAAPGVHVIEETTEGSS